MRSFDLGTSYKTGEARDLKDQGIPILHFTRPLVASLYFNMRFTTSALLSLAAGQAAYAYTLVDNFVGPSFLTGFDHQAIADPTNGRVSVASFL